jgi:RimJ/RimL family protein N-acetyltransferase
VREDNLNAKALYERMGFEHEGIKKQSMLVGTRYFDCYSMVLLRRQHDA